MCLTPRNEMKSIVSMYQYGDCIANNIVQTLSESAKFQEIPEHFHKLNAIPLGSKGGVICFNKMVTYDKGTLNQKMLSRDNNVGPFRGEPKWIESEKKGDKIN